MRRDKLASVKGDSSELDNMVKEAAEVVKEARSEVSAMVVKEKNTKTAELEVAYTEAKDKVNKVGGAWSGIHHIKKIFMLLEAAYIIRISV